MRALAALVVFAAWRMLTGCPTCTRVGEARVQRADAEEGGVAVVTRGGRRARHGNVGVSRRGSEAVVDVPALQHEVTGHGRMTSLAVVSSSRTSTMGSTPMPGPDGTGSCPSTSLKGMVRSRL